MYEFLGHCLLRRLVEIYDNRYFDRGLESMKELESRVEADAGRASNHEAIGWRFLQDAKPLLARKAFERSIAAGGSGTARLGMVCALERLGLTQQALDEVGGLGRERDCTPALLAAAWCHEQLGEVDQARELNLRAGGTEPDRALRRKIAELTAEFEEAPTPRGGAYSAAQAFALIP